MKTFVNVHFWEHTVCPHYIVKWVHTYSKPFYIFTYMQISIFRLFNNYCVQSQIKHNVGHTPVDTHIHVHKTLNI